MIIKYLKPTVKVINAICEYIIIGTNVWWLASLFSWVDSPPTSALQFMLLGFVMKAFIFYWGKREKGSHK